MANRSRIAISTFLLAFLLVSSHVAVSLETCNIVKFQFNNCWKYLNGKLKEPLFPCCEAMELFYNDWEYLAGSRQAVCTCLKRFMINYEVNPKLAAGLPEKCGVNLGYTIGPDTDCTKVDDYFLEMMSS